MVFGRHVEQTQLRELLDRAGDGPAGLLMEGVPGIGKSTLFRSAVGDASRRGYGVFIAAPSEPDANLAFGGLGDLLDAVSEPLLDGLPEPQRRALTSALSVTDPGDAPPDPQALPRAVLTLLRARVESAPLLIAVDDEQWLDRSTARVLGFALRRVRAERICVLVSRRTGSEGPLWPELERGYAVDQLPSLSLQALEREAIEALVGAHVPGKLGRPVLRRIYEVSGGNPLHALAIGRELRGRAASPELPIPDTLAGAIAQRLDRVDPGASEALLVVAAVSAPSLALIQSAVPGFALGDLDTARAEGVVDIDDGSVRFTHPLLASVHYSRASARQRRQLHRILAEVCAGDQEQHAHHLALGAEAPDHEVAVTLEQAAGLAARRGAPEVAATLLEQAAQLTPADAAEAMHSRRIAAAEQHSASGDLVRARAVLEPLLEQLSPGPMRARALLALTRLRFDDFTIATALADEALANAEGHDRVCAQIELVLGEISANQSAGASADHAAAAVRHAERAHDPGLLAEALAFAGVSEFFGGHGVQRELMERAIVLEPHADTTTSYRLPRTSLGCQLLWSDLPDEGRPLLERSLQRAIDRGEESDRDGLLFHLAHLEWEAGNNHVARRYTDELVRVTRQLADEQAVSYRLWLEAYVALRMGNLDVAGGRATEAAETAQRIGDAFIVAFSTAILAAVDLWSGQPGSAHERLPTWREMVVGGGGGFIGSLTLVLWTYDIEALIGCARFAEAELLVDELRERASRAGNPNAVAIAHRCRALLLAAGGRLADALEAADAAMVEHERRPLPFEVGRSLIVKGSLERRLKRKSAAKQSLERALAVLEPIGAGLWVAGARDELDRVGLRRAAAHQDGLTPAQSRVTELVLAGMTNREIAATLYMSLRTVETHLTRIYSHFGVRSRAQLIATRATARSS